VHPLQRSYRKDLFFNLGTKHFSKSFITASEVSIFIDQLNKNKSAGIDGIGYKIIKLCKGFESCLFDPL